MGMSRELVRGPLLSVLFFGLLIGVAPGMATADLASVTAAHMSPESCSANGGVWAYPDTANPNGWCSFDVANPSSKDDWCDQTGAMAQGMAFDAAIAGAGGFLGLPWFGAIGIGMGVGAFGIGLAQFYNCTLGGW